MGVRSLRLGHRDTEPTPEHRAPPALSDRAAVRDGLLTSLSNPKLAVFFVALFPQFIPRGAAVLWSAVAMDGLIVPKLKRSVDCESWKFSFWNVVKLGMPAQFRLPTWK